MNFEEVKEYIVKVKDSKKFRELAEFTYMADLDPSKDIYENIREYLERFGKKQPGSSKMVKLDNGSWGIIYEPDYDYFISFLDHYLNDRPAGNVCTSNGWIDLDKTIHLEEPRAFLKGQGFFLDNKRIFTNGSVYFSKTPISIKASEISSKESIYCPLIASYVAKTLDVEAPSIDLAVGKEGPRILSKNFLKPNEEMFPYASEQDENTISAQLKVLESYLKSRRCIPQEIEDAKLEFLKQEFVAKMIGLKDQKAENSQVIVSIDEDGNRHVKLAPMYDLDFCFHIAEKADLPIRRCDNGKTDIASLIEQYKEYPGFMEFAKSSIQRLNMQEVFNKIYKEKGLTRFRDYETDEEMMNFMSFVNNNKDMARECIDKIQGNEGR